MINILVLADVLPDATKNSGDRRLAALLEGLAKVAHIACAVPDSNSNPRIVDLLERAGVEVLPWAPRWLDNALAAGPWDVCLMERWHLSERCIRRVREVSPGTVVVVDSVDVHFRREAAGAALGLFAADEISERKLREIATYAIADQVLAVNASDQQALADVGVTTEVAIVPNLVPLRARPNCARMPVAMFVGGFAHAPNVDGLMWFCDRVWADVRKSVSSATLKVIGSDPTEDVLALSKRDGIEVIGYVETVEPYLDAAAVSIAPLRYGAGMKGKVCEALAAGVPVVTTAVGADGLGLSSGENAIIADSPEEFAAGVVWVLQNQGAAERIGSAGRETIATLCSVDSVFQTIARLSSSSLWQGRWAPSTRARWRRWAFAYHVVRAARRPFGLAKRSAASWLGGRS